MVSRCADNFPLYQSDSDMKLDARPDYSVQSTDYRMEVSCGAALNHINNFMHPQSVIVDGSHVEDQFFLTGIRKKANSLDKTLIELPKNAEQNLMWITRLDSNSLSGTFLWSNM